MSEARTASGPHPVTPPAEDTTATGQTENGAKRRSPDRVPMEDVTRPARDLVRMSETRRDGRRLTRYARRPADPGSSSMTDADRGAPAGGGRAAR